MQASRSVDLTNSNLINTKLDNVNFINSEISGINLAKFKLNAKNFINNKMCDTLLPWKDSEIVCE